MEYHLCRAMEVARLSPSQLNQLHNHERDKCLMPFEIEEVFGLPLLKETWMIPENDAAQSAHNQNLRSQFRVVSLIPLRGDLSAMDVNGVHKFDLVVRHRLEQGDINLVCNTGSKGKRFKDTLPEE